MEKLLKNSQSMIEQDLSLIWHPFTQMQNARVPIPIVRGKGLYLYAENGDKYLDGISSWWVNLHGHTHPYIAEKIKEQVDQLEQVIFADFTHAPAVELAYELLSILPSNLSKIFYSDNGSTAVEVAIKMALQYQFNKKKTQSKLKIIGFRNSYHGDTFGAMAAAGKNHFNRPFWSYLFEVESIDPPIKGQEDRSLLQLKNIIQKEEVACFIFEPLVLGSGGMIIYPAEGLNSLISYCHEHQVLTIADEVMTGFGRTGTLFACDQLEEKPDFICLSKGLTGGFLPLGVTACDQKIYDAFLSDEWERAFLHGHSYAANPIACSSALASLHLLKEEKCIHQRQLIARCHQEFCQQWKSHPKLKRCESLGTILALQYLSESDSYFQSFRDRLYDFFLKKRILLRPLGNVLYVLPPYCIQENELLSIYEQIIFTLEGEI